MDEEARNSAARTTVNTSRKRKVLSKPKSETKIVCMENYSWWTNMMLGIQESAISAVSVINTKNLKWKRRSNVFW